MLILGIESTAHTFGVGIVTGKGQILANAKDSYSSKDAGMIPNLAAEHHRLAQDVVMKKALQQAKISLSDINYIAYSAGPGIDPCLWVGYNFAKEIAEKIRKPLIAVNHCAAHLSIGKLWNKLTDPVYLYVSGVNTQIIIEQKKNRNCAYVVLGETLDLGLGNMLDKLGRILGLGFPAGPKIEQLAKRGNYLELPYVVKGMDVSFSGILTKVQQLWERKPTVKELLSKNGKTLENPYSTDSQGIITGIIARRNKSLDKPISPEDLCFSVQETCFAMVTEVAERALAHTGKKELVLIGGVGANRRLGEMLQVMCRERKALFYNVPIELAGDQGAMIAWEGFLRKKTHRDLGVKPQWRVDEV